MPSRYILFITSLSSFLDLNDSGLRVLDIFTAVGDDTVSPDCYLDTKNRISSRVKSNVFWWRFLLYITGQRYDRNSFIDGLSAAINNTIIYKSRPMVVCIRGEAIGSAPFTPGGPGAAAGTCTCYSPLLYYSIHQSIFFFIPSSMMGKRWCWFDSSQRSLDRSYSLWYYRPSKCLSIKQPAFPFPPFRRVHRHAYQIAHLSWRHYSRRLTLAACCVLSYMYCSLLPIVSYRNFWP